GLLTYAVVRAELQTAHALGKELLALAQQAQDTVLFVAAHRALGATLFYLGEVASAHTNFAQGIALYAPQQHRASVFLHGQDSGVICHIYGAWTLWILGYPDQGLARSHEAVTLAQQSAHPYTLSFVLIFAAVFHQLRLEMQGAQERATAAIRLSQEQGFPVWMTFGSILHGWAVGQRGQAREGLEQMHQSLQAYRATGS